MCGTTVPVIDGARLCKTSKGPNWKGLLAGGIASHHPAVAGFQTPDLLAVNHVLDEIGIPHGRWQLDNLPKLRVLDDSGHSRLSCRCCANDRATFTLDLPKIQNSALSEFGSQPF